MVFIAINAAQCQINGIILKIVPGSEAGCVAHPILLVKRLFGVGSHSRGGATLLVHFRVRCSGQTGIIFHV